MWCNRNTPTLHDICTINRHFTRSSVLCALHAMIALLCVCVCYLNCVRQAARTGGDAAQCGRSQRKRLHVGRPKAAGAQHQQHGGRSGTGGSHHVVRLYGVFCCCCWVCAVELLFESLCAKRCVLYALFLCPHGINLSVVEILVTRSTDYAAAGCIAVSGHWVASTTAETKRFGIIIIFHVRIHANRTSKWLCLRQVSVMNIKCTTWHVLKRLRN